MDRKDFRLNGKVPDTKLFELANRTQQTISPLQFLLNENGYPVKILAPENLIQNFKEKRTDIEEYFIGDLTKKYFDTFECNLSNVEYLLKQYTSSLLFQVLFINKKVFQAENTFQKKFYFVPNSFEINCKCEAFYHHEEDQFVQTSIKGISIDNYTLDEVITGIKSDEISVDSSFFTTLNIEYKTDKRTKQLIEANAEFQLVDNEKRYRTYLLILKPINPEL